MTEIQAVRVGTTVLVNLDSNAKPLPTNRTLRGVIVELGKSNRFGQKVQVLREDRNVYEYYVEQLQVVAY